MPCLRDFCRCFREIHKIGAMCSKSFGWLLIIFGSDKTFEFLILGVPRSLSEGRFEDSAHGRFAVARCVTAHSCKVRGEDRPVIYVNAWVSAKQGGNLRRSIEAPLLGYLLRGLGRLPR